MNLPEQSSSIGRELPDLRDVTLVCCENRDQEKARALINDMTRIARFGDTQILTGDPGYGGFLSNEFEIGCGCKTSHVLTMHLDGFIINPELWEPTWLQFDYMGAPWPEGLLPYRNSQWIHRVGNGGFSLRSRKFCERVAAFPRPNLLFDLFVSQEVRAELEGEGFKFAPLTEALKFSRELVTPETPLATFGFHGFWPVTTEAPPAYYQVGRSAVFGAKRLRLRGLDHMLPAQSIVEE